MSNSADRSIEMIERWTSVMLTKNMETKEKYKVGREGGSYFLSSPKSTVIYVHFSM